MPKCVKLSILQAIRLILYCSLVECLTKNLISSMASNKAIDLGVMTRVENLRSIWPDEARDFTPWLAKEQNLKLLGDAVGIDLVLEEKESSVGAFSADIYVKEEGTNRRIIIENQLEATDHDHLGKLITYASGKSADVVIWVVKKARDEHRQAIEWLNQRTDNSLGFFLLEIELWKIDNSRTAVKFNVVEQPNEWAKSAKGSGSQSAIQLFQLDFWSSFREAAKQDEEFMQVFTLRKEHAHAWYSLSIGNSTCDITLRVNTIKNLVTAAFYIRGDKELFAELKKESATIEQEMGGKMTWNEANKDCTIYNTYKGDVRNKAIWPELFSWLRTKSLQIRKVFKPRVD